MWGTRRGRSDHCVNISHHTVVTFLSSFSSTWGNLQLGGTSKNRRTSNSGEPPKTGERLERVGHTQHFFLRHCLFVYGPEVGKMDKMSSSDMKGFFFVLLCRNNTTYLAFLFTCLGGVVCLQPHLIHCIELALVAICSYP